MRHDREDLRLMLKELPDLLLFIAAIWVILWLMGIVGGPAIV